MKSFSIHHQQQQKELTLPEWLDHLLSEKFFTPCSFHYNIRKNVFCVDCLHSLCSQCLLLSHSSHRLLQVRRYVYQDVVCLEDAEKLIDCSHVQVDSIPYISNGMKVVFLNQRPTNRLTSHSGNICGACDRVLQDPFLYCCISCKVDHVLEKGGLEALHGYLRHCDSLQLNGVVAVDVVNGFTTPDSVLEPSSSVSVLSSSNSSGATTANAVVSNTAVTFTATTTTTTGSGQTQRLFPGKKRTPKFPANRVVLVSSDRSGGRPGRCVKQKVNRRKRVPRRSALL